MVDEVTTVTTPTAGVSQTLIGLQKDLDALKGRLSTAEGKIAAAAEADWTKFKAWFGGFWPHLVTWATVAYYILRHA